MHKVRGLWCRAQVKGFRAYGIFGFRVHQRLGAEALVVVNFNIQMNVDPKPYLNGLGFRVGPLQ